MTETPLPALEPWQSLILAAIDRAAARFGKNDKLARQLAGLLQDIEKVRND
jgi:hypothetical protein